MARQITDSPSQTRMGLRVLVAVVGLMGIGGEARGAEPTIDEIEAAWQSRRQQLQSVECEWDATRLDKAGALNSPFGDADADAIPKEDKISNYRRSLRYHNAMVRTEDRGGDYLVKTIDEEPVFRKMDVTLAWNGKASYSMFDGLENYPTATVRSKPDAVYADKQFNWILAACCLPFPGGVDLKEYRMEGRKRMNDKEVLVLQKRKLKPMDDAEIWLSPEPPHVVERIINKSEDITVGWRTVDYVRNEDGIEVPKSAFHVFCDKQGKDKTTIESTVTSFKINPSIDDSDFIIKFPDGTFVIDSSSDEVRKYILRNGGEKRMISPSEIRRGATYKELLETEEGQAARKTTSINWSIRQIHG